MLDSFLSDFNEIRDTLGKEGNHQFFGKNFSFFSAEPILFYNNEKDVIVYANSMFNTEFNYTINDLEDWKYSIYPLLNNEDQLLFKNANMKFNRSRRKMISVAAGVVALQSLNASATCPKDPLAICNVTHLASIKMAEILK